ncbi:hypothetical protein V6N13_047277 [Hibiscus sabdariffa]|uniref:Agglutinin domain-containing protein n=1 Tax=Hibiscus sabdariffa TaxID=183260 RepID=A0ABR2F3M5_9ROSI
MASVLASDLSLPRYIALGLNPEISYLNPKGSYLSYARGDGKTDAFIQFLETNAESPYAKFEVEFATARGLFHIRSCQNNKYWERNRNPSEKYWITATANKKEEDQSKESCTLFKFISVDPVVNTVRIVHVQSGNYLCSWGSTEATANYRVLANYNVYDHQGCDIYRLIDWNSLLILPKYVAFKGNNGKYLCLRHYDSDRPYMQFASEDIGDSTVPCEIFVTTDGIVRIKPTCTDKFWRRSPNWIWADSDDTSSNNKDTLFRPVKVDNKTIGLINLGNNYFCKRLTTEGKESCLNAAVPSLTQEAQLTVEEPVLTREIYGVKYNLDYSRVYDESVLIVARNSASNYNQDPSALDVKLSYTDTKTSTWKTMFSLKLGMKATMDFSLPLIFEGKIEVSGEVQSGVEWGETKTSTTVVEVVHKVVVPAMTKVTVNLVATKGTCDVPFTYMQRDTLYNGSIVTSEIEGGTYTGSNYYNIDFVTKEEKLE